MNYFEVSEHEALHMCIVKPWPVAIEYDRR